MSSEIGALVLVATPIGNLGDLSPRAVEALRDADVIAAEDTRVVRRLLTHSGIASGRRLRAVHARNERAEAGRIVEEISGGALVVYASDAGMPGISDPGEVLVRACIDAALPVSVVPGPSALLAALVLSGLPTGRFTFEGFLPRKGAQRRERMAAIAAAPVTTVVFESPRRVMGTLDDLCVALGPDRGVAVAREITKVFEEVRRGPVGEVAGLVRAAGEPRGEHVIVIAPAARAEQVVGDDEIEAALVDALGHASSVRDAATEVAAALGVPKRRAYGLAIRARANTGERRAPRAKGSRPPGK